MYIYIYIYVYIYIYTHISCRFTTPPFLVLPIGPAAIINTITNTITNTNSTLIIIVLSIITAMYYC